MVVITLSMRFTLLRRAPMCKAYHPLWAGRAAGLWNDFKYLATALLPWKAGPGPQSFTLWSCVSDQDAPPPWRRVFLQLPSFAWWNFFSWAEEHPTARGSSFPLPAGSSHMVVVSPTVHVGGQASHWHLVSSEEGLLAGLPVLCLLSLGACVLFSTGSVNHPLPAVSEGSAPRMPLMLDTSYLVSDSGHPSRREVVSHWNADLCLPDDQWYGASFHVYIGHCVSSFEHAFN